MPDLTESVEGQDMMTVLDVAVAEVPARNTVVLVEEDFVNVTKYLGLQMWGEARR